MEKLKQERLKRQQEMEHRQAYAHKVCDQIAENLPSREVVLRFRRRHAGFVRGYFVTDSHHLGLLYSQRLMEEGGHDAVIGHAIHHAIHAHFAEYHHLGNQDGQAAAEGKK